MVLSTVDFKASHSPVYSPPHKRIARFLASVDVRRITPESTTTFERHDQVPAHQYTGCPTMPHN